MTLAARCYPPNACIEMRVPYAWSPQPPCCPTCKQELRVLHCCGRAFRPVPSPFALPQPHRHQVAPSCEEVARRLGDTERALKISGWYYGNLDWQAAQALLKDAGPGAFLIRNSGDKNFKFSLSVQTERGPTSVRLVYDKMYGYFRLDSDWSMAKYMPRFRCVVDMAAHYTRRRTPGTMWVDRDGHAHSPVLLSTPLRQSPPSLLHAARLAVHKAIDRSVASNPFSLNLKTAPQYKKLPLPPALLDYLGEYPYSI